MSQQHVATTAEPRKLIRSNWLCIVLTSISSTFYLPPSPNSASALNLPNAIAATLRHHIWRIHIRPHGCPPAPLERLGSDSISDDIFTCGIERKPRLSESITAESPLVSTLKLTLHSPHIYLFRYRQPTPPHNSSYLPPRALQNHQTGMLCRFDITSGESIIDQMIVPLRLSICSPYIMAQRGTDIWHDEVARQKIEEYMKKEGRHGLGRMESEFNTMRCIHEVGGVWGNEWSKSKWRASEEIQLGGQDVRSSPVSTMHNEVEKPSSTPAWAKTKSSAGGHNTLESKTLEERWMQNVDEMILFPQLHPSCSNVMLFRGAERLQKSNSMRRQLFKSSTCLKSTSIT